MPMPKLVSNRQLRRTVVAQQTALEDGLAPVIRTLAQAITELVPQVGDIRGRVDAIEMARPRTLWQRLRWLLRGN